MTNININQLKEAVNKSDFTVNKKVKLNSLINSIDSEDITQNAMDWLFYDKEDFKIRRYKSMLLDIISLFSIDEVKEELGTIGLNDYKILLKNMFRFFDELNNENLEKFMDLEEIVYSGEEKSNEIPTEYLLTVDNIAQKYKI